MKNLIFSLIMLCIAQWVHAGEAWAPAFVHRLFAEDLIPADSHAKS